VSLLATGTFGETATDRIIRRDPSGAEVKDVSIITRPSDGMITDPPQKDETATAILKKKKKPNSLMSVGPGIPSI
jgi:hypothetical protein